MSEWAHITGVISCRSSGVKLLGRLLTRLAKEGFDEVASWKDLRAKKQGDPSTLFRTHTEKSSFAIVLLDQTTFDAAREDEKCTQQSEVDAILQREDLTFKRNEPFVRIVILLQDKNGHPNRQHIEENLPEGYGRLVHHVLFFEFRLGQSETKFAQKIATEVVGFFQDDQDARASTLTLRSGPPGAQPSFQPATPPSDKTTPAPTLTSLSSKFDFQDIEMRYMRRRTPVWAFGQTDSDPEARKVSMIADGRDLFAFRPQRFVEFKASERRFPGGGDESVRGHEGLPVSHWLFSQQDFPMMLIGDGGAGKTTTVTAAACGFASVWSESLRKDCAEIAGEWIEQVATRLHNKPRYVPVLMRCEEACSAFSDSLEPWENALNAVAAHLRLRSAGELPEEHLADFRKALLHRLREQPYALIFDALDEVQNQALARRLFIAVDGLAREVSDGNSHGLLTIFTSRPVHPIESKRIEVELARPIDDSTTVESFVERFAPDPSAQRKLKERVRELSGGADGTKAPLTSPLLLNAFCCISRNETVEAHHSFRFCSEVIEYFLRGREFPILRKALNEPNVDSATVAATARRILQRIGYVMVRDGHANCHRSIAIQVVHENRSGLGLRDIDATGVVSGRVTAEAVIDDIVREFALLQSVEQRLSFTNAGLFGEFLAGEYMAFEDGVDGLRRAASDKTRLSLHAWRGALRFARALARARAGFHDEDVALEAPAALLELAESAEEPQMALLATRTAIEMIAESPPGPTLDGNENRVLVQLGVRARAVYSARYAQWSVEERSDLVDTWYRCGQRTNAVDTMKSVDRLAALWLSPRKRWISLTDAAVAPRLRVAAHSVLVSEFSAFVADASANDDHLWPLASEPEDRLWTGTLGQQTDDESREVRRRRDHWNIQLERPGAALTYVSWFEADAYCRWLTRRLHSIGKLAAREVLRLPTLTEWNAMMASIYGDREYPCDEQDLEKSPTKLNWEGAGYIGPTSPGVFDWMGTEGLYDFGSNVRTWLDPDGAESEWRKDPGMRTVELVGGSWSRGRKALMTRGLPDGATPTDTFHDVGIRLVRVLEAAQ